MKIPMSAWVAVAAAALFSGLCVMAQEQPLAPPEVPAPVAAPLQSEPAEPTSAADCPQPAGKNGAKKNGGQSSGANSAGRMADPREVRRERRKAWIFSRYAGPIEMQDKTPYPYGYYGDYYHRGWKPDWVYPLPPPPIRFEEPPVIRHPEGMPDLESSEDQPPVPAAKARSKAIRK